MPRNASGNANAVWDLAHTSHFHAGRTAVRVGRADLSYGGLRERASHLAGALRPLLKTHRVGILGSRSHAAYIGVAAAGWAGAAYVPLNLKWPAERLIRLMGELELDALVIDANGATLMTPDVRAAAPAHLFLADDAPDVPGAVRLAAASADVLAEPVHRSEADTAYIVFTSGSTGEPKGVVVSCGALARYLDATENWTAFTADDRVAEAHDITFDLSVHNTFLAWRAGAALHVMSPLDMMAPQSFVRREKVTCWMSVPTIANNMRGLGVLKPGIFPDLRLSVFCGEPLALATAQDWAAAAPNSGVENIYGPTEGTVVCTRQPLTDPPVVTPERQILSIGPAYPNFDITIRDEGGAVLPDGQTGEIVIASDQLSDGYFNRPEQTAKAFRVIDGRRHYFTGDLGYRDADGRFHHMGRTDNQVKLKGNRVELEEVEFHLRAACGTDLAVVVAWPRVDGLVQGLVGFAATDGDVATIRARMAEHLPDYMIPARIELLDALPRNINDKIDRNALIAALDARSVEAPALATPQPAETVDA